MAFLLQSPSAFLQDSFQPSVAWPALGAALYGATIYGLKQRTGPALSLKAVAIVHNIVLIALSTAMGVGSAISLYDRYTAEGWDGLVCSQRGTAPGLANTLDGSAGYWMALYHLSKYYEFGDTVLLACKKKETIFLHLYHHAVMVFLTWSWSRFGWFEGSLWCVLVNSIIHFFMYIYYLMAVLGFSCWWKRYLTAGQIFQFVTGFVYVCFFFYKSATQGCGPVTKLYVAVPTFLVNISFIVLFSQFFQAGAPKKAERSKKNI